MSKRFYWKKIRPILLTVVLCSVFFLIIMAITSNKNGNLTIYIDRASATKSLSISESNTLKDPKGKVYGPSITKSWDLEEDELDEKYPDLYLKDGDNSGDRFIAYTFYLFNSGIETLDYSMSFNIDSVSKNLDEAIRVRLYVNNELTTYAKKSPISNEAENGTVAFASDSLVVSQTVTNFEKGAVTKYTIVMWIEADDNECTNELIGGSITMSMKFSVLGSL